MKNAVKALFALLLCAALLAGCVAAPAAGSSEVFQAPDSVAQSAPVEPTPTPAPQPEATPQPEPEQQGTRLNPAVLALFNESNAQMKAEHITGESASMMSSSGFPAVLAYMKDFAVPLEVWLEGSDADVDAGERAYLDAGGDGGFVDGDIFPDTLWVEYVHAVNDAVHDVLFVSDVPVTYDSINEALAQQPELKKHADGTGGMDFDTWSASYYFEGYGLYITFVAEDETYIPIGATVWIGGADKNPGILT